MKTIRKSLYLFSILLLAGMHSFAQSKTGADTARVNYALNLSQKVTDGHRLVPDLQSVAKSQLPVGIPAEVGGKKVVICVDSARLTPQGAMFNAYAAIEFPQTGQKLAFAARNLAFNPGGIGGSSQAKLALISDVSFPVFNNVNLHLVADGSNFVEWDCNGFKRVHLKGEFVFSRDLLVPDSVADDGVAQVKAPFEADIADPNNFLIATSISPFSLPNNKDLSFSVYELTADFSDIASPPNAQFPSEYQQEFAGDINLWRGFYIKRVSVGMPAFLSGKSGRTTIEATDFLVDDQGISGTLSAKNIVSIGESTSAWPLSIEDISIKLLQSRLIGGGLGGHLNIPFLGSDSMKYSATIAENTAHDWDYRFTLQLADQQKYNIPLGGTIALDKNSLIEFGRVNGQTFGRALLNGSVNISQSVLNVEGVKFQSLELVTESPYVVGGKFDFACNKASLGDFPLSFSEIGLQAGNGKFALSCLANLNIMNSSDNSASVAARFFVRAAATEKTVTDYKGISYTKHSFAFSGIDVNKINVDVSISAFAIKGGIELFRDDPVYGNAFSGQLSLTMPVLNDPVQINAIFGSKQTYRYFHFDIYAPIGKVPVYPPFLYITGILGGVSYHMSKPGNIADKPDLKVFNAAMTDQQAAAQSQQSMVASQIGYIPDSTTALHLVGGVTMAAQSEKAFNGNAILEMAFREGGGLKYIQFTGVGYFLSSVQQFDISLPEFDQSAPIASSSTNAQAAFWAKLKVLYDNDNHAFHANLSVYLNIADIIKGVDNGMIGEAVIHFDPHDWYVYVGRPSHMAGVDIARVAQSQSYFMMGTQIESIPPPPQEVQDILGETNLDISSALDAYATGRGIAFGAHIKVGIDVSITPFFASIQAGAGADIMIRQYQGVHCKDNNGPIGWNGWYATGQAYAYLQAKAGIRVGHKSFSIFSAGLAALLQTKLPNPSWFKGEFGGTYSVLFGLVKGHFNIKFTIGDQCELVSDGSEIGDIKVIQDMKPDDKLTGVDVFAYPQVSFNTGIEQEMRMMNMDDKMESYRIKLDECSLYNGSQRISGTLQWNSSNDVVSLSTPDVLPPQQSLRFTVNVHWEKKINGAWQPLMNDDGTPAKESKMVTFATGDAPTNIPEENVAYSYPVKQQYNFHPKEYGQGYMQLKRGQPYLFQTTDTGGTYNFVARFTPLNGSSPVETPFTYDDGSRIISFAVPQNMALGTIYNLDFVKKPVGNTANDRNRTQTAQTSGNADNSVTVTTNNLNSTITQNLEHNIYNNFFRTSNYAAFSDKWNSLNSWQDLFDVATGNLLVIAKRGSAQETFDHIELYGRDSLTPALIQTVALSSPAWYSTIQNPLMYELYGSTGLHLTWRDEKDKGVGPLKAVNWRNLGAPGDYSLTTDDLQNSYANAKGGQLQLEYYLSWYAFQDFIDLRNAAAFQYLHLNGNIGEATRRLLNAQSFTDLLQGNYPVQVQYTLPGTHKVTSTQQLQIRFNWQKR
jgi:hypothetical protein